jgi:pectin methylesterase-like acyl-CoA thioesterase
LIGISGCGGDPSAVTGSITVPDDYSSIQEAINAAEEGDVIVVKPGKYVEVLILAGKTLP